MVGKHEASGGGAEDRVHGGEKKEVRLGAGRREMLTGEERTPEQILCLLASKGASDLCLGSQSPIPILLG